MGVDFASSRIRRFLCPLGTIISSPEDDVVDNLLDFCFLRFFFSSGVIFWNEVTFFSSKEVEGIQ